MLDPGAAVALSSNARKRSVHRCHFFLFSLYVSIPLSLSLPIKGSLKSQLQFCSFPEGSETVVEKQCNIYGNRWLIIENTWLRRYLLQADSARPQHVKRECFNHGVLMLDLLLRLWPTHSSWIYLQSGVKKTHHTSLLRLNRLRCKSMQWEIMKAQMIWWHKALVGIVYRPVVGNGGGLLKTRSALHE